MQVGEQTAMASAGTDAGPAVSPLRVADILGKPVRIAVTDGRIFEGQFHCVDDAMNIILHHAKQTTRQQPMRWDSHRHRAVVDETADWRIDVVEFRSILIPGKFISAVYRCGVSTGAST